MNKKNILTGIGVLAIWVAAAIQLYISIWMGSVNYWGDVVFNSYWFNSGLITGIIAIPISLIWGLLVIDSQYVDESSDDNNKTDGGK